MKRRLLALLLVLGMFTGSAWAAGSEFIIENGTLVKYNGSGGAVVVPEGVTAIGSGAFQNCAGLTAVTLPETVLRIGDAAFAGCGRLEQVNVPAKLTRIGSGAFTATPWMAAQGQTVILNGVLLRYGGPGGEVSLPWYVNSICSDAFDPVRGTITGITIPGLVTTIRENTFRNCSALKRVTLPASVTTLEAGAFANCTALRRISLPAGVRSIHKNAFSGCNLGVYGVAGSAAEAFCISRNMAFVADESYVTPTAAYASTQWVWVNDAMTEFSMYAIKDRWGNDTNYIKLRDLAVYLNVTDAHFNVVWDGSRINIYTGVNYQSVGGELETPFEGDWVYRQVAGATNVNGISKALDTITLTDAAGGGYTYYKLRDLGAALGFQVEWSSEMGIQITT